MFLEQVVQRSCGCPSLEVFRLNGALSSLAQWKVPLPAVRAWNWMSINIIPNKTILIL